MLSFDNFKKMIDKIGPYLIHIDFCNWGEPLLNKEIFKMIEYVQKYLLVTKVDTNLNVEMDVADAIKLISSGLDRLNVSLDGASQETYGVYRRNGSFEKVVQNVKTLVEIRRNLNAKKPHMHWQFLVFKHNEHEIEKARKMANEIGFDSIGFTAPFCAIEWAPNNEDYNRYVVKENQVNFKTADLQCEWPWDGITINADGSVSPCCSVEDEKDDFGNILTKGFWRIWNGRDYRKARKYIRDRKALKEGNVCTRCDHIGSSNHTKVVYNEQYR